MCSTNSLYTFDTEGNTNTGFPVENSDTKLSYQSPLICHEWDNYQIIGGTHGDFPEFYSFNLQGEYSTENWPNPTAEDSWTYNAPLAIGLENTFDFYIFSQPGADGTSPYPTIHAFNPDGTYIDGFPYERTDGLEGFITAMYSDDLTKVYIFTCSNMKDVDGNGFIHAYIANTDLSDFTEISGFPIQVQGFTFMNGINLGDVNNNGKLDLVALSYDQNFEPTDSIHINIFELTDIYYNPDYCFSTYKGNNLRNGYVTPFGFNADINMSETSNIKIYQSLITEKLNIESDSRFDVEIYNSSGVLSYKQSNCEKKCIFSFENYSKGMYFVKICQDNKTYTYKVIKLK
ncbi:MAG: hypothetical protein C0596_11570 [Marinilabiliales bacterium]|nr:MAG: hypothetical protein C0596_11570 [Marinilabiliales bacterium]